MPHQHPVELIIARTLISNLTTAAFLVDRDGVVVFFNEAAGDLLGVQFEECGPMEPEEWGARFAPTTPDGRALPLAELPLAIAVSEGRAAHSPMRIRTAVGVPRDIQVTAFPLAGRTGQTGSVAIFWSHGSG